MQIRVFFLTACPPYRCGSEYADRLDRPPPKEGVLGMTTLESEVPVLELEGGI